MLKLNKSIVNKSPLKFSVWSGSEQYLINLYLDKIAELGYTRVNLDSFENAYKDSQKASFVKTKKLYVVSDDIEFATSFEQQQVDKIKSDNVFVLLYSEIDKRKTLFKSEYFIEFIPMTTDIINKHLSKLVPTIDYETLNKLIVICESDYTRCINEVDKIKCYSKATGKTETQSLHHLISNNVIFQTVPDVTFSLIDSILAGDLDNTPIRAEQYKLNNDNHLGVLSLLYTNFRNMLLCQAYRGNNASKDLNISNYIVNKLNKYVNTYSLKELRRALSVITKVEQDIKLGTLESSVALDYVIINIIK